jgi:HD superfamily phosphohydrolase
MYQRLRDPVHDLIEIEEGAFGRTVWKLLESQPFQRLRRIKQLGFSDLVYPSATHSRFAHSVGVFHTARLLGGVLALKKGKEFEENEQRPYSSLHYSMMLATARLATRSKEHWASMAAMKNGPKRLFGEMRFQIYWRLIGRV